MRIFYTYFQLLKALFGANLAALWGDEVSKYKRTYGTPKRMQLSTPVVQDQVEETFYSICGIGVNDKSFTSPSKKANSKYVFNLFLFLISVTNF